MRRVAAALAMLALGGALPAFAGEVPAPPRDALERLVAEWAAQAVPPQAEESPRRGLAVGLPAPASEARAATAPSPPPHVVPVGDVDGDGGDDIALIAPGGNAVDARRGRDGATLWSYVADDGCDGDSACRPSDFMIGFVQPIATASGQGFLAIRLYRSERAAVFSLLDDEEVATLSVDLRMIDGAGQETWQVVRSGTVRASGTKRVYDGVPFLRLTLNAVGDLAGDVLVGLASATYDTEAPEESVEWREDRELVDGADGAVTPAGSASWETRSLLGHFDSRWHMPLPDVTGDGLDDYAVHDIWTYTAVGGVDGAELWSRDDLGVIISDRATTRSGAPALVAVPTLAERPVPVELVDAASGETVWRRVADRVAVGARGAVWLLDWEERKDSATRFAARAMAPDGRVVHTAASPWYVPPKGWDVGGWFHLAGDVTGDGVDDFDFRMLRSRDGATWLSSYREVAGALVDGRTGRVIRRGGGWLTFGAALDGRGDDLLAPRPRPGGVTVSAVAGDTGRRLWSARVEGRSGIYTALPVRLDADRAADVLFVARENDGAGAHVALLSGADGRVLWSIRAASAPFGPGFAVAGWAPAPARVARVTRGGRLPATGAAPPWAAVLCLSAALAIRQVRRRSPGLGG